MEGHVRLKAGQYKVTVLQGARGETDGAEPVRVDPRRLAMVNPAEAGAVAAARRHKVFERA
jgi:hypothetical protein